MTNSQKYFYNNTQLYKKFPSVFVSFILIHPLDKIFHDKKDKATRGRFFKRKNNVHF